MICREMTCTTALNPLKRKIPYGWDLNIYRGCAHACQYCYAIGTHGYLGGEDFAGEIYVKTNIVEVLEQELRRPGWAQDIINLGGVTDSYQPAEAEYRLMPEILKLMIKYRNPVIISTKSALVLRDFDLIEELARFTYVNIAVTVTTMDEAVRAKLEPGAAPAAARFAVLQEFRRTRASRGLHLMPILPHLTDSRENLAAILAAAKDAGVDYVLPGVLYLRGRTRAHFFTFLAREYPDLLKPYTQLYRTGGAGKEYKDELYAMLNPLRAACGLTGSYMQPLRARLPQEPDLFNPAD